MWPVFAGQLTASHVGEWVTVNGRTGLLHCVIHRRDHPGPRLILMMLPGGGPVDCGPRDLVTVPTKAEIDELLAVRGLLH